MFDSQEELLKKIRLGEDSVLELKTVQFRGGKVDSPYRRDLADEMAAFANTNDGVIIFGVDDVSREILGVPIENWILWKPIFGIYPATISVRLYPSVFCA